MSEGLGLATDRTTVDTEHLRLLSVFYFVGAGLAALGMVFVGLHYALMSTVMNPAIWKGSPTPPPDGFFDLFKWIYVVFGAWLTSSFLLNLLAGFYLRAKKHRTFCFVAAAANCLHMPFGTVLGIFTIIVLARDSVRVAFAPKTYHGGLE